jgi:hypothetical protein
MDNFDRAADLVLEINEVRAVVRELKAALTREMDYNAEMMASHPLMIAAEAELKRLHGELVILI